MFQHCTIRLPLGAVDASLSLSLRPPLSVSASHRSLCGREGLRTLFCARARPEPSFVTGSCAHVFARQQITATDDTHLWVFFSCLCSFGGPTTTSFPFLLPSDPTQIVDNHSLRHSLRLVPKVQAAAEQAGAPAHQPSPPPPQSRRRVSATRHGCRSARPASLSTAETAAADTAMANAPIYAAPADRPFRRQNSAPVARPGTPLAPSEPALCAAVTAENVAMPRTPLLFTPRLASRPIPVGFLSTCTRPTLPRFHHCAHSMDTLFCVRHPSCAGAATQEPWKQSRNSISHTALFSSCPLPSRHIVAAILPLLCCQPHQFRAPHSTRN